MANTRGLENTLANHLTFKASADLTNYRLVTLYASDNAQCQQATTTDRLLAMPRVAAKLGQMVTADLTGVMIGTASGAVVINTLLKASTVGKVIGGVVIGTDFFIGASITPAAADGDLLTFWKFA